MTVNINTLAAERAADLFNSLCKKELIASKDARSALKNPKRAVGNGANVGTAFECRSPNGTLSTPPEMIIFYHTGKSL